MSYEEDESSYTSGTTPARQRVRYRFGDVDANRAQILKNNQLKYVPRKPDVLLCIALGVFLLPGLLLYLGGLFIYNKVSEYKFNQAQAKDLQEANDVKAKKPKNGADSSESENSYSKSHRSLSRSKRDSSRSSKSGESKSKKKDQVEALDSSKEYTGTEESSNEDDTESPTPGSPTGLIK